MAEENNSFEIFFNEEFDLCLNKIEAFFAEQGPEPLQWWHLKEIEIIEYIVQILSLSPYVGQVVERGAFKGIRRITYGKSRHLLLNYLRYYMVHEQNRSVDVINILPSRTKRKRITK